MGIEIPTEYGGSDASFTTAIIAIEELAKVDPSISVMADVHVFLLLSRHLMPEYSRQYSNSSIWLARVEEKIPSPTRHRKVRIFLSI
jgi:alkylation response protein AidB-like acyl-CoA dehydrogenase